MGAIKQQEKWGYIDKEGKLNIPLQFDEAYDFHEVEESSFDRKQARDDGARDLRRVRRSAYPA